MSGWPAVTVSPTPTRIARRIPGIALFTVTGPLRAGARGQVGGALALVLDDGVVAHAVERHVHAARVLAEQDVVDAAVDRDRAAVESVDRVEREPVFDGATARHRDAIAGRVEVDLERFAADRDEVLHRRAVTMAVTSGS